jgi:hypothetical protein
VANVRRCDGERDLRRVDAAEVEAGWRLETGRAVICHPFAAQSLDSDAVLRRLATMPT